MVAVGVRAAAPVLGYRPDIDGLRALAVLLVVLSHAEMGFPGGFIGVDVFFVISGFLITRLIAAERETGRFSFPQFYLRRAKRLLPALFLVLLATMGVGFWLFAPSDFSLLADSALSALALASNLFFAGNTGGYFSPDAAALPLLHIWSLSLEEQFYLLWPAALLLLLRLRSRIHRSGVVALAAAVSFGFAQHQTLTAPVDAYFLLPARAGEFLVGAFVALQGARPDGVRRPILANAVAALGLLLILAPATLLNDRSTFPGLNALAPCLGAALVIVAPGFGPNLGSRLLATRPLVGIGLISYSVYLWHWPLISCLRYLGHAITPVLGAMIVAASLGLGFLSWLLIERAFRARLDRADRLAWTAAGVLGVALVAAPVAVSARDGLPGRFPFALMTQDQLMAERARYWRELPVKASLAAGEDRRRVLVVGNSHAYDLAYALLENGFPGRIKIIETSPVCFNFGRDPVAAENAPACAARLRAVLESPDLKTADAILLHDDWRGRDPAGLAGMIGDLRARSSAPIYVVGPKMTFAHDALDISRRARAAHRVNVGQVNAFAAGMRDPSKIELDRTLKAYFDSHDLPDAHYISALDAQCGPRLTCDILSPAGEYLYFDAGHFTLLGARRFGAGLKRTHPELFAAGREAGP